MKNDLPPNRLSHEAEKVARRCLRICDYRHVVSNYAVPLDGNLPLVAFAHQPYDARSSCPAFLSSSPEIKEKIAGCRALGFPLFFAECKGEWEIWKQTPDAPRLIQRLPLPQLENFFTRHSDELSPGAIYRAKTTRREDSADQSEFVSFDLLPAVEEEAGQYLVRVFERMVAACGAHLPWKDGPPSKADAEWLIQSNFWLLAAKLLHDKRVDSFIQKFDLQHVEDIFQRVDTHYRAGTKATTRGRLTALRAAAAIAQDTFSLHAVSTETLGALFEEALISKATRKLLGTHRTPTYLVDYMLAKLATPISEVIAKHGPAGLHIFEPACGHAPFLTGTLRWLNELLPTSITSDAKARQRFLRDHLHGCDTDSFGIEIARLSLTLADIPNPNGWKLQSGDMFAGDYMTRQASRAMVTLANPPFEAAPVSGDADPFDLRPFRQAAEVVRRTLQAMPEDGVFGFVLPHAFLDSPKAADFRRWMLGHTEILEISVFPYKMFKFAEPETAMVLGRKTDSAKRAGGILYRRVDEDDKARFRTKWLATTEARPTVVEFVRNQNAALIFAELNAVWEACEHLSSLEEFASVAKGSEFHSVKNAIYDTYAEGRTEGFQLAEGSPGTHLLPHIKYFDLRPIMIRRGGEALDFGKAQVIINHVRAQRAQWRHKAFIDEQGRPVTSNFLIVRPQIGNNKLTLRVLWALCNSPIANAYTITHSPGRHILARILEDLPVPNLEQQSTASLEQAVSCYLRAAREYTARFRIAGGESPEQLEKFLSDEADALQLNLDPNEDANRKEMQECAKHLRALHWRVDAEVLNLYALPPERERELLDFFDGVSRVGVPFIQKGYIPLDFRDVLTLDEYLQITDEWDVTNAKRQALLDKEYAGTISPSDATELEKLQRLLMLRNRRFAPMQFSHIDALLARIANGMVGERGSI